MTRLAEFSASGITATTVSRMERAGEVVRLARGLYQLADAALDAQPSLAEAARLVPKDVICLASALAFHGLTDPMPPPAEPGACAWPADGTAAYALCA